MGPLDFFTFFLVRRERVCVGLFYFKGDREHRRDIVCANNDQIIIYVLPK